MKIWSLPKHENLTTGKKYCGKVEKLQEQFLLFSTIFSICLQLLRVQLHIYLLNVVVRIIFSSILQILYVEVRISRSISESPLEFEITSVDCIFLLIRLLPFQGYVLCCDFSWTPCLQVCYKQTTKGLFRRDYRNIQLLSFATL